jgi:hypothetical protein
LSANVAVTFISAFMVTVHAPVPLQPPPLQPVKIESAEAVAFKTIWLPIVPVAPQVCPQVIPAAELVTVPVPAPALLTFTLNVLSAKFAVIVVSESMDWPQ